LVCARAFVTVNRVKRAMRPLTIENNCGLLIVNAL
jgi:hypothetical protein